MPSMVRKHFLLPRYQIEFLSDNDDLPEAEHVRRALDDYIEKKKRLSASPSASVRRLSHGR